MPVYGILHFVYRVVSGREQSWIPLIQITRNGVSIAGISGLEVPKFEEVKIALRSLVSNELFSILQPLSHWRKVACWSLFYRYFRGRCPDELHLLHPRPNLLHVWSWRPSYPKYSIVKDDVPFRHFLPITTQSRNKLPRGCFTEHYTLIRLKFMVNCYRPRIVIIFLSNLSSYIHDIHLILKSSTWRGSWAL